MWAPICQVGTWQGMFGEVEVTEDKLDQWISAFGPDEKIPVTFGHLADPDNQISTGEPAPCWISGVMRKGDMLFGNYVDWSSAGLDAITSGAYKNVSIEANGERLTSVALLGSRTPAVEFHNDRGRFAPLDMAGCLDEAGQVVLSQNLRAMGVTIAFPYNEPPKKITDLFDDDAGPKTWTEAFNSAYEEYDDEAKANATAWAAIKEMGYTKGDDGKYRKSKKAATAAQQGGRMSLKEKVLAALKDLTAKWETELDESPGATEPEPVQAAAAPEAKPAEESPEVKALAERLEKLENDNESYRNELAMTKALSSARELCEAAHIAPKFEEPMAQYMAGMPEITLAEPERDENGEVTKEYKLSRNDFFATVLVSKGTEKLDDPKKLTEAPRRKEVEAFAVPEGVTNPERQAEIVKEANDEALAAGKGDDKAFIASLIKSKMGVK